ncbi:MAG: hypothetical protein ACYC35_29555 [Pirellulales bacterium]
MKPALSLEMTGATPLILTGVPKTGRNILLAETTINGIPYVGAFYRTVDEPQQPLPEDQQEAEVKGITGKEFQVFSFLQPRMASGRLEKIFAGLDSHRPGPTGNPQAGIANTLRTTDARASSPRNEARLISAIRADDCFGVLTLLRSGAEINEADERGWTPLHVAADLPSPPIVLLLLKFGANAEARSRDGVTSRDLFAARISVPDSLRNADLGTLAAAQLEKLIQSTLATARPLAQQAVKLERNRYILFRQEEARLADLRDRYALNSFVVKGGDDRWKSALLYGADERMVDSLMGTPLSWWHYGDPEMHNRGPEVEMLTDGTIPDEFYVDPNDFPVPREVEQTVALANRAAFLAALAYGDKDPRCEQVRREAEGWLEALRKAGD